MLSWPGIFFNLVFFWVLLLVNQRVCRLRGLLHILVIYFSCYVFIQHYYLCTFSFHIFLQNCFRFWFFYFIFLSVFDLYLCTLFQHFGRIFFHYFGTSRFCIASLCPGIFCVSLLSPISFDLFIPVVLSELFAVVCFFHSIVFLVVVPSLAVAVCFFLSILQA